MTAPIVLMTDFGTRDSYVGVIKAIIAGIAPNFSVIDLTHVSQTFANVSIGEAAAYFGTFLSLRSEMGMRRKIGMLD